MLQINSQGYHPHPKPVQVPQQVTVQVPLPTVKKEHKPTEALLPDKRHAFNVMNTEAGNKLNSWIV